MPMESGVDYRFDKDYLDQQEVNSGDNAKDQIEHGVGYWLEEDKSTEGYWVTVTDPHKVGGGDYTVYKLKGSDDKGEFEVERRYKEFEAFWECISKWFPGFFVPPIPKKVMKNKG